MTEELRSAIGNLIKEKDGDLVRDTLVKAGNKEAVKAFDDMGAAITEYVSKWVEDRIKKNDEKIKYLAGIVEDVITKLQAERRKSTAIKRSKLKTSKWLR